MPPDPLLEAAQIRYRQQLEEARARYRDGAREAIDAEAERLTAELANADLSALQRWETLDRLRDLALIRDDHGATLAELDRRAAEAAAQLKAQGMTSMAGNPAGRMADDLRRAAVSGD